MTTTPEEIPTQMIDAKADPVSKEIAAIADIIDILSPFNWAAQERMMTYVRSRCAHEFRVTPVDCDGKKFQDKKS